MSSATKTPQIVLSRYANAFLDLARDQKIENGIEADLTRLQAVLRESGDMLARISASSQTRKAQDAFVAALGQSLTLQPITRNFLNLLVQKRRLGALGALIDAAQGEMAKRRGEMTVEVRTAQDLSPDQMRALQDSLAKGLGKKIAIQAVVEPALLGGMIVTIGSHMIDDSVATKLRRLQTAMSGASNENSQTTANPSQKTKEV